MRISFAVAALVAGCLSSGPTLADEPAPGFGRRPVHAPPGHGPRYAPAPRHHGYGYGAPRHRHFGYRPVGVGAGPMPPFYDGMGGALDHLADAPVRVTLYREAYIGRGLLYNTPPTLDRPGPGFGAVLSARY